MLKLKTYNPENMRRMMANQAEAERSRRARIILALAEEQAAGKLLEAGKLMINHHRLLSYVCIKL
jgi:regulator of protease activity HflC (stomatin/prohibitin superfamily)